MHGKEFVFSFRRIDCCYVIFVCILNFYLPALSCFFHLHKSVYIYLVKNFRIENYTIANKIEGNSWKLYKSKTRDRSLESLFILLVFSCFNLNISFQDSNEKIFFSLYKL